MNQKRFAGAAVATPLTPDLGIDHAYLVTHVTQLLERGIDLLTLFGTTGEGPSFSRTERSEAIRRCREAGISADQLGSGVFALSPVHAGEDARAAFDNGCGHVLLAHLATTRVSTTKGSIVGSVKQSNALAQTQGSLCSITSLA